MSYLILAFSIVNFLLGVVIISRPKTKENVAFFFFALLASIWTFTNFYLRISQDVIFLKISYANGIAVATLGLIWTILFLKKQVPAYVKFIIGPISLILYAISVASREIILSLGSIERFGYTGTTGQLFPIYGLYLGVVVGLILFYLITSLKEKTDQATKNQRLFVLLGAAIFSSISLVVSFIVPTFFGSFGLTVFDNFGFSIFLSLIVYATIKHRLFDIKIIATQLLVFVLWIFILVRTILSNTPQDKLINGVLLVVTVIIGWFLIRSVIKEIEQRERIESLAIELEKTNERLRYLDQQKSEFISIASHQLRSPLTAIKGYTSMLMEGSFGKLDSQALDAAQKVFQSAQHLVNLVEDLLNVSRIEQGGMKYNFAEVDLAPVIGDVVNELSVNVKNAGLTIEVKNDGFRTYNTNADAEKIRQVILNLIDNSIKYTPSGGITVSLSKNQPAHTVTICIRDTGIGIPKEVIPMLFEKFSRAEGGARRNTGGSGIGLYLAKEIVKAHKGRVWVESEGAGKGSQFYIELPGE